MGRGRRARFPLRPRMIAIDARVGCLGRFAQAVAAGVKRRARTRRPAIAVRVCGRGGARCATEGDRTTPEHKREQRRQRQPADCTAKHHHGSIDVALAGSFIAPGPSVPPRPGRITAHLRRFDTARRCERLSARTRRVFARLKKAGEGARSSPDDAPFAGSAAKAEWPGRPRAGAHPVGMGMQIPPLSICAFVRKVLSARQLGATCCGIVPSSRTFVT